MQSILNEHNQRYPKWGIDDLYKLIHQAAMGSEHALRDIDHVRDWLRREISQLGPGPDEPLIDPISPDGRVVRVHLRPFARLHLDTETLLQAFFLTAKGFPASANRLLEFAGAATRLAQEGALPFDSAQVTRTIASMQEAGFPALHHSRNYEEAYHPAYRVVARELLPKEIAGAG